MERRKKDVLDILFERTLEDLVSGQALSERVWANISLGVQERLRQTPSGIAHLRPLGREILVRGGEIGAILQILLASFYLRSNGEGWTERLILTGHSTVPLHYSFHH